jgi:hypothetical protein
MHPTLLGGDWEYRHGMHHALRFCHFPLLGRTSRQDQQGKELESDPD